MLQLAAAADAAAASTAAAPAGSTAAAASGSTAVVAGTVSAATGMLLLREESGRGESNRERNRQGKRATSRRLQRNGRED